LASSVLRDVAIAPFYDPASDSARAAAAYGRLVKARQRIERIERIERIGTDPRWVRAPNAWVRDVRTFPTRGSVPRRARLGAVPALAAAMLLALPSEPAAHEIPARVTILAFVKPEGDRLRLLVRVPLEAMRDVELPLRGPGYLELDRVQPLVRDAARVWIADYIQAYEGDTKLTDPAIIATRISLPSDRSFATFESATASVTGAPLPVATDLPWNQAMLDVMLEYPIRSASSRFSLRPALAHLGVRTTTVLRFVPPAGGERAFAYPGDPGLVRLDPRWHQAAFQFLKLGVLHILGGIDHLLFVLCLVIPIRRFRSLVAVVTAFTVAHSITLVAAVLGLAPDALWFPPLIEVLIALSIVYMAFENIVGARVERRWAIAFGFGLVHGFGFSFALRESLQFAGSHLATSLAAFNIGVELGQLLVLAIVLPALALLYRHVVSVRMGTILLSALVAHTAWHWMLDRGAALAEYRVQWPVLDAAFALGAMRWAMLLLIIAGVAWGLSALMGRLVLPEDVRPQDADRPARI
jgi:hypothetical protein